MKRSLSTAIVVTTIALVLGFSAATTAQAAVVFEHVGSADPTTEGFDDAVLGLDSIVSADAGPPANWRMIASANGSGSNGYGLYGYASTPAFAAALTDSSGWTLTTTAKLNAANIGYEAVVRIFDTINRLELHLVDGTGVLDAGLYYTSPAGTITAATKIGTIDPTTGFHTYQMIMNPNGPGTADDGISFYVNGVFQSTVLRSGMYIVADAAPSHFFGTATYTDSTGTDTQWALVRLETGQNVIPEPASVVLMGLGACVALSRRRQAL